MELVRGPGNNIALKRVSETIVVSPLPGVTERTVAPNYCESPSEILKQSTFHHLIAEAPVMALPVGVGEMKWQCLCEVQCLVQ